VAEEITQFFYKITPEVILNAVEELGVRCSGKIVPLNSLENRVYDVEVDLKNSSKVSSKYDLSKVIKFYRPGRWTEEQILEEHGFISDLHNQELPVVSPLAFPDGQTLHNIVDLDLSDSDLFYAIFPKVGGRILDEYSDNQIEMLGRLIARMHQVGRAKDAKHRIKLSPTTFGRKNCKFLLENKILPVEIEERYAQLVAQICDTADLWFEGVALHRIHGDCHLGNILWSENIQKDNENARSISSGYSCRLVDFDDFAIGPAVQDLWLIVPGRDDWNLKQRELLVNSYSELIEFDPQTLRLIEPLRALRLVHFSTWIAKRWEDPAFKNIFFDFGTQKYWREELIALEEVLQIIQCGEVI